MAALFYIEPTVTYDLDVMVILNKEKNDLNPLKELYEWANKEKLELQKEHIIINEIPVQFLPAFNALTIEAVDQAVEKNIDTTPVKVISSEYLIAIMLDTNRPIDRERIIRFKQEADINKKILNEILKKYNLLERYESL